MRRLVVNEFLSIDGVMQGPGSPDEDRDGGFAHGGWQVPFFDEGVLASAQEGMAETDAYLFGRRTYQIFAAYWPTAPADDPFGGHLNATKKYVASRTLKAVEWQNSEVLTGDVAEAVAELKGQPGGTISVLGSGNLVQTLIERDLVDEFSLVISPIVLGSGKRLFRDSEQVRHMALIRSTTTPKGNVVVSYGPEAAAQGT
jgi:dihydrofolate reductase